MEEQKNYYLGLDLGTGSLGWAVTDEDYEIVRAHGKALWGVRLFNSAMTAEERRVFRTSRRRLQRRGQRIRFLQELLAEEINSVDPGFFLRMKESRYVPEDKKDAKGNCPSLPYALFVDDGFTDKEYHRKFPTIYHLRKYLMTTSDTPDIRLVYLALHHFMKHRGHFLLSGSIDTVKDFRSTFEQFIESLKEEELDFHIIVSGDDSASGSKETDQPAEINDVSGSIYGRLEEILKNKSLNKSGKKTELCRLLKANTKCEKAFLSLIAGGTVKLSELFGNPEFDEAPRPKLCFADANYEEYCLQIEEAAGELFVLIEKAKTVYDWSVLADILGDHASISEAKIAVYEKHKQDLAYLKKLVREHLGACVYKEIFTAADSKDNYPSYIGMTKYNGRKTPLTEKQCGRADFYKFLKKKVLDPLENEPAAEYLRDELAKETFLPRQVTKDNGVIPYQIHLQELDKILDNLSDRMPVIAENASKIRQLFTFRIPYYVGPLNGVIRNQEPTNWVVRKESGVKIYPWNFEEIVDLEASAEKFIRRMTNKCTYLTNEDVLPKYSLLYSKFTVLNELNNLKLNGDAISVDMKQKLYTDLFCRYRKVTQKKLKDYLKREGTFSKEELSNLEIGGIDGDFKGSLTAYHDFKERLTGCQLTETQKETIILNITLFGDDERLLKKRLGKLYPELTTKQQTALCSLHYRGWGRLSDRFLEGIMAPDPKTGEAYTIIRALWETNDNLMQLLSVKYDFVKEIERENGKDAGKAFSYETVRALSVSPAVKRQIWQTMQIVDEICHVMKGAPSRIFIEMAREKQDSRRTVSRKRALTDLYKKCREEERDWINELEHTDDSTLRSDKLYLYYTQKGRCMYSQEPIDINDLWDNTKYDIDHIYPQSKVMDDSLDNRVLVKRTYNADKTDNYPIADEIREKRKPFWKSLLEGGFISKEKYQRLTRSTRFEEDELAGFINRQLVETRQGTKAAASVLKQLLPDTEIVYVKAKITSQFRQDFDLLKVRDMNDLHHAKDAYLNIVTGNVYHTKFTRDAVWYIRENSDRSYNLKKMFTSSDVIRCGVTAWKAGDGGTIATVKRVMRKNNILVTRRSYEAKGKLFKQQIKKKGKGQFPIKGSDERLQHIDKYGAYDEVKGTYFTLVESYNKKGDRIKTIEYIPLYLADRFENSPEEMRSYLQNECEMKEPRVLLPKIKIDSLFQVDGFYMWLSGRSGNRLLIKNANQLLLSDEEATILKKTLKFATRYKENKSLQLVAHDELGSTDLIRLYDVFLDKLTNSIYALRLKAQRNILETKREQFIALSDEDKTIVLSEILHFFQCQSTTSDVSLLFTIKKDSGKLGINKQIDRYNKISLINQSPTGIYEQEIDLLKL